MSEQAFGRVLRYLKHLRGEKYTGEIRLDLTDGGVVQARRIVKSRADPVWDQARLQTD